MHAIERTHKFHVSRLAALIAVCAFIVLAAAACSDAAPPSAQSTKALAIASDNADLKWGPCPPLFPAGCEIAALNGDPAKPNADVFLRVPGKYEIPGHAHTSAERMILVTGELATTYKGEAQTTLTPGTYAYGPANLAHKATCVSDTPCTLFIAFEHPVDATPYEGAWE